MYYFFLISLHSEYITVLSSIYYQIYCISLKRKIRQRHRHSLRSVRGHVKKDISFLVKLTGKQVAYSWKNKWQIRNLISPLLNSCCFKMFFFLNKNLIKCNYHSTEERSRTWIYIDRKEIVHHCNDQSVNSKFKWLLLFQREYYLLSTIIQLILIEFTMNTK